MPARDGDSETTNDTRPNTLFVEGTPVFDAAGDWIGDVGPRGARGGMLEIRTGDASPRALQAPLGVIARHGPNGVYLSASRAELAEGEPVAPAASLPPPVSNPFANAAVEDIPVSETNLANPANAHTSAAPEWVEAPGAPYQGNPLAQTAQNAPDDSFDDDPPQ